ncbi:MAG TPA: 2-amino-4-hydroxy-6-hydroxymethyldihydropteridine diphosphokinase [Candidatus Polarisedimenticolia bacterium]|nr:2-amino-4-hydroxy-6-hydroxymethyldihydropteridine diphosphokinase [Candidatus Polarisedimenticolia bacterium]
MEPNQRLAYIGAGSRDGNRLKNMAGVAGALRRPGIEPLAASSLYETEPVDLPGDRTLYNGVLELATTLEAAELMSACLQVEQESGRRRNEDPFRPLDLDLLLYADLTLHSGDLEVPHPRMHMRRFVLVPLAEVAPQAVHPGLGLSARLLLEACRDPAVVRRIAPPGAWFEVAGRFR